MFLKNVAKGQTALCVIWGKGKTSVLDLLKLDKGWLFAPKIGNM
jgi:hypothetical protein